MSSSNKQSYYDGSIPLSQQFSAINSRINAGKEKQNVSSLKKSKQNKSSCDQNSFKTSISQETVALSTTVDLNPGTTTPKRNRTHGSQPDSQELNSSNIVDFNGSLNLGSPTTEQVNQA